MIPCTFYHDAKDREYYLPVKTATAYKADKRPHTQPQGCKKVFTQDRYAIYILNDGAYPQEVRSIFDRLSALTLKDAHKELKALKCTKATYKHEVVPFARYPDKVLFCLFGYLDKSSLASIAMCCSRFFKMLPQRDLRNLCVNAYVEGHPRLLEWGMARGNYSSRQIILDAAKAGNSDMLNKISHFDSEFKWQVLERLYEFLQKASPDERLDLTLWALKYAGDHRNDFRELAAEVAINKNDPAMLKAVACFDLRLTLDSYHKITTKGDPKLVEALVSADPTLAPSKYFTEAALSGNTAFLQWALGVIDSGKWTVNDRTLLYIGDNVRAIAIQKNYTDILRVLKCSKRLNKLGLFKVSFS